MSTLIAEAAARIALLVDRELAGDAVEVWTLYLHARRILHGQPVRVQSVAAEVALRVLVSEGVSFGELDDQTGEFRLLEATDLPDEVISRIRALGREPNMGDVGWLVKNVLP